MGIAARKELIKRKVGKHGRVSPLEEELDLHLTSQNIEFKREYRFGAELVGGSGLGLRTRLKAAGLKDWRFDFAIPALNIAIEVEGGIWSGGRHTRGKGYQSDCEKYNAALVNGWHVLRFTGDHVKSGEALRLIELLIDVKKDA